MDYFFNNHNLSSRYLIIVLLTAQCHSHILQLHSIMEAFILADRVVTAQHMSRLDHKQLKYLKRYDLPSRRSRKHAVPKKSPPQKENVLRVSYPIPSQKIRNLLSTMTQTMPCRYSQDKSTQDRQIDKYFSCQSDPSKNIWEPRKPKDTLLIRPIQPQPQHYDAKLAPVSQRAPCWTFTPHNRCIGQPPKPSHEAPKHPRSRTTEKGRTGRQRRPCPSRASESEQYVLQKVQRKIYQEMRERTGLGEHEQDGKLQYSPLELGRGTAQILFQLCSKKYHLINDAYFKKFLVDIQNMSA